MFIAELKEYATVDKSAETQADLSLLFLYGLSIIFLYTQSYIGRKGIRHQYFSSFGDEGELLMGKQSTRENKNIYQLYREAQGLTREKASENMVGVSASRIEKIEYELQEPTPYDIIQMADCYKRPDLCNYYCSHKCTIGERYVPEVEISELSYIILETIASLNAINPLTTRLIQIMRDGKITDDEFKDFAFISKKLDEISLAIDSLNLWVDKTASENNLNIKLLNAEKEKLK